MFIEYKALNGRQLRQGVPPDMTQTIEVRAQSVWSAIEEGQRLAIDGLETKKEMCKQATC